MQCLLPQALTCCPAVFFCRYLLPPGSDSVDSVSMQATVGLQSRLWGWSGSPSVSSRHWICATDERADDSAVGLWQLKQQNAKKHLKTKTNTEQHHLSQRVHVRLNLTYSFKNIQMWAQYLYATKQQLNWVIKKYATK